MESQPILVKDLVVVARTSGLAGVFLTCITGGGRDLQERIFYKSGAGTALGRSLGFRHRRFFGNGILG